MIGRKGAGCSCDPCRREWIERIKWLWEHYREIVRGVKANGRISYPDGDSIADLGSMVTDIKVNGQAVTPGPDGRADLGPMVSGIQVNGRMEMPDSSGAVDLGGLMDLDTAQTAMAAKTFEGGAKVPSEPLTVDDAVSQRYVESTVTGVNNLVHKSGNEEIAGNKTFVGDLILSKWTGNRPIRIVNASLDMSNPPTALNLNSIAWYDKNGTTVIGEIRVRYENGTGVLQAVLRNSDNTTSIFVLARGRVVGP